jgi:hypothetical protein
MAKPQGRADRGLRCHRESITIDRSDAVATNETESVDIEARRSRSE